MSLVRKIAGLVTVLVTVLAVYFGAFTNNSDTQKTTESAHQFSMSFKTVSEIIKPPSQYHWVGDGFPVRTMLDYNTKGRLTNPFILLDYAAPYKFEPHFRPRGVGLHPHRGFETVTFAYKGEVAHKDSHGNGGTIKTGDVQWMTAGSGLLHEEFHSQDFTDKGGDFEMVQLWVNLPSSDKMNKPRYQEITSAAIADVPLPNDDGQLRVVAGSYGDAKGPALTHTPMDVFDIYLHPGKSVTIPLTAGWVTLALVREGSIEVGGKEVGTGAVAIFSKDESELKITAKDEAGVLLLSGEPITEPLVGHGPFVMNSKDEIFQAFRDYDEGKFGAPE